MRRGSTRHRVGLLIAVTAGICVLTLDRRGAAAPSLLAPDALLEAQWHLKDRSLEAGGANVRNAWPMTTGAGVVIGIVDDGLQWSHPDLSPNYLSSLSFDFNFNDADPQPFSTSGHGTSIAGVAAARGDNTIGVSGAAPQASLAGLRLTAVAATDAQESSAFNYQPNAIHILNNSWNPSDNGTTLKGPGTLAAAARQSAITSGRQGKGRIFVWSSGGGRLAGDDCNFDGYANSRFAIAVGASNDSGNHVPASEGCSALMVLAPAGGNRDITTTDLVGTPGYDSGDYTSAFGDTSTGGMNAAAGTVSGAVALMLARNPNLTWRDVQHILRRTAVRITPTDPGWTLGAYPHNERLGFGLLDATAAVSLSAQWANVPGEETLSPSTKTLNIPIPDINATGVSDTITISSNEANFIIEHIEVDLNVTHTWRGDLEVKLTSPAGVISNLAPIRPLDNGDNFPNWKFGSVRHWGESAAGVWKLTVADRRFQDVGTWNSWTLRIYGTRTTTPVPGGFGKTSPVHGATNQPTNPTLSWGTSSGATSYEYCYDTTNDNACSSWISAGSATSAGVSGLTSGVTYFWQVRANNTSGTTYADGSATSFWNFTTAPAVAPPGAFGHSSPANGASGVSLTPTLIWGSSSGATTYQYCYDTTNDNACSVWTTSAGTSAALSGLSAGTTYFWHVRASNAGGTTYADGSATAFWNFTTIAAPGAFGRISPPTGATNQLLNPTLTWSASAGAANYDYCIDTSNDNLCTTWIGAGAGTSVGLTELNPNTTYYWHVRAVNGGGTTYANGVATAFWNFTTGAVPGPFGHSSPANGATGISLTPAINWTASANATNYDYCYDTTNDNACSNWIGVGGTTSAALSGLAAGTTYFWHVRASNTVGTTYADGSSTAYWSFTTIAAPGAFGRINPPTGATGQSVSPTLTWSASAGVANYDYCVDTTNDSACSTWLGAGASTSVGLTGLNPNTTYYWHVRAVNGGGTTYANGVSTAFWNFTTGALPGAFSHGSPANGATGISLTPLITWTSSSNATNYDYCYDTTNDNACSNWISAGGSTSAGLSGLTAGIVYYWQVRATNGSGTTYANGASTAFWSFTTIPLPGAFNRTSPANGATGQPLNPTLSWNASAGAANYDYCYDTTNDNACSSWVGAGASTSVGLTGLSANTTYYWHVRAVNGGGTTYAGGSPTSFWSFRTRSTPKPTVDLNGDGNGDVLTYDPETGAWARQVSLPGGGFATTTGTWLPGWVVSAVSFNTDALTDFFLFNEESGAWVKMLTTPSGFTEQASGAWWQGWKRIVIDLDGDELSDLFLYDPITGQYFRCLSSETGFHYSQGAWNPGWEIYPVALNTDALGDMFLFDRATGRWFWVIGQADGIFTYPVMNYWATDWELYAGDLDGDGRSDWFLYRPDLGQYYVAFNNGNGYDYVPGYGWAAGWTPTVMDLNADGVSDLFLYNKTTGNWVQLQGNGAGQFSTIGQGAWSAGWDLYPTDFNGDGRADLLLNKSAGDWYQAINTAPGAFTYVGGLWARTLSIIAIPPPQ